MNGFVKDVNPHSRVEDAFISPLGWEGKRSEREKVRCRAPRQYSEHPPVALPSKERLAQMGGSLPWAGVRSSLGDILAFARIPFDL